ERGSRNVSLKSIEKLADRLGVSVSTLFSDVDSKRTTAPLHPYELVEILLVEDNENDVLLVTQALKNANITNRVFVMRNGAAALAFLFSTGEFAHRRNNDRPQVI